MVQVKLMGSLTHTTGSCHSTWSGHTGTSREMPKWHMLVSINSNPAPLHWLNMFRKHFKRLSWITHALLSQWEMKWEGFVTDVLWQKFNIQMAFMSSFKILRFLSVGLFASSSVFLQPRHLYVCLSLILTFPFHLCFSFPSCLPLSHLLSLNSFSAVRPFEPDNQERNQLVCSPQSSNLQWGWNLLGQAPFSLLCLITWW